MNDIRDDLAACTICRARFEGTHTQHQPRPIVWFDPGAKLLNAGQAPGMRVHRSGVPFDDPSGERLRDWLGLEREHFYDQKAVAIVPMGFCFPGYDAKGSDLPPPAICARTWRGQVLKMLGAVRVQVLIGGYAMKYHLPGFTTVTAAVQGWRDHPEGVFALPHPSWRNTGWLKKNPWFATDVLPRLRAGVAEALK